MPNWHRRCFLCEVVVNVTVTFFRFPSRNEKLTHLSIYHPYIYLPSDIHPRCLFLLTIMCHIVPGDLLDLSIHKFGILWHLSIHMLHVSPVYNFILFVKKIHKCILATQRHFQKSYHSSSGEQHVIDIPPYNNTNIYTQS